MCWGIAIVFLILMIIIYQSGAGKRREQKDQQKKKMVDQFAKRNIEIIQESLDIINKTKNLNTAIGRFDTIFTQIDHLSTLAEQYQCPDITKPSPSEMKIYYSNKRNEFIKDFILKQSDDDIGRAGTVTRNSSKIAILDKALLRLYDGKKAINDDAYADVIKAKEDEIHRMIKDINSSKG